ncbi:hypothetical protein MKW98_021960 [Papaver atlanticum]|uniref:Uncharacterized protein n=1 Tax=Papaver atlanticum TaxID=357466 RepID=A0AAD4TJL2_9MAGN|nr:hypothetical protein MKW98_021960 [Papaver atlanticum]
MESSSLDMKTTMTSPAGDSKLHVEGKNSWFLLWNSFWWPCFKQRICGVSLFKKSIGSSHGDSLLSGDIDMCVPLTRTGAWTRSLGYKIVDKWRPLSFQRSGCWYTQGYYQNLTFLIVRGPW